MAFSAKTILCVCSLLVFFAAAAQAKTTECARDYTLVGRKCYKVNKEKVNWATADRKCRSSNGQLFELDNGTDMKLLTEFLISSGIPFNKEFTDSVWTDINAIDRNRKFRVASSGKPIRYKKWIRNQPDNAYPEEDCVALTNSNGYGYHDMQCKTLYAYVCQA